MVEVTIDDIDIVNAEFIIDLFGLEGESEDAINQGLDELDLKNSPYQIVFSDGTATISGG